MIRVTVDSGICGCRTTIRASSSDKQHVTLEIESTCPHVVEAQAHLSSIDAYDELFKKLHETRVYTVLSERLPHVTCPLYAGFLKAIEAAAGLALPKDVAITIERVEDEADG